MIVIELLSVSLVKMGGARFSSGTLRITQISQNHCIRAHAVIDTASGAELDTDGMTATKKLMFSRIVCARFVMKVRRLQFGHTGSIGLAELWVPTNVRIT